MKTKTIIVHDPDERAVVALEGVGDRSRFRLDKVAFEWRDRRAKAKEKARFLSLPWFSIVRAFVGRFAGRSDGGFARIFFGEFLGRVKEYFAVFVREFRRNVENIPN